MSKIFSRRGFIAGAAAGLGMMALGGTLHAAAMAPLKVGDMAPPFTLTDQHGKVHSLSDYRGHTVVMAFYLKDFTAG